MLMSVFVSMRWVQLFEIRLVPDNPGRSFTVQSREEQGRKVSVGLQSDRPEFKKYFHY